MTATVNDNSIYKVSSQNADSAPVDFDPFAEAPNLLATAPSTEPQREIWAAAALGRDAACAYNESICLLLDGECDPDSLQRAIRELVARHEVLRVSFSPDGQTLCLAEQISLDLSVVDIQNDAAKLQELREREVVEPFDLLHGPLFRCRIIRVHEQQHAVLITAHHTVCDGWSFGLLLGELAALYNAHRHARPHDLDAAPGFLHYAREQADGLASRQAEQLAYWREALAGANTRLELPHDFPRPARRAFTAGYLQHRIPNDILRNLKTRAARRGATSFTAIGAAVSAYLHRISGQDDLIVGVPAAGQASEGLNGLAGHCVSLLPIRSRLDAATTFDEHLENFSNRMSDGWENRDCSMGRLIQELALPRDASAVPLVQLLLNIDRRIRPLQFEGLAASFNGTPRKFENFEMFMNAIEDADGLLIECTYDATLYSDESIRARLQELHEFIARLADSDAAISELDLLTDTEKERLAIAGAGPRRDWPPTTIDAMVREQCEKYPQSIAVSSGAQTLRYADLARQVDAVRASLAEQGAGRGDVVGVLLERDAALPSVLLGILACGAAYLPLDADAPADRLQWMLEDAGVRLIVSSEREREHAALTRFGGRVIDLATLSLLSSSEGDQQQGKTAPAPEDPAANRISMTRSPNQSFEHVPDDPAYIIYTSGSTGKPKGVVVPHGAVSNFLRAMQELLGVTNHDRFLALTTLTFDIAVLELLLPLAIGAHTEIISRDVARNSDAMLKRISGYAPTVMQATPATWQMLLGSGWQGREELVVLSGGEALPVDLARQLLQANRAVWNVYGPTETTVWSSAHRVSMDDEPIPVGKPICNTTLHVLDKFGKRVPPGVAGELYIGGAGVTSGYLNRPELTRERFVTASIDAGAGQRLYRTGDRVRWRADNTLEYLGRVDFQIKLRGHRMEPGEIETLLESHPAIERAVVVVREIESNGTKDARLVAYLVTREGDIETSKLRDYLAQQLPAYMLPQHYVVLDRLPLNASGKVDRKQLPAPDAVRETEQMPPVTDTEKRVAATWEALLGAGEVSANDNFFEIGGHSLLAARCITQLREILPHEVPMVSIFENPVLADFARQLDALANADNDNREVFEI